MKRLILLLALFVPAAFAAPFLVSDAVPAQAGPYTITHCAYTRGATATFHPVEAVAGGVRCRIDLASDSKVGTVTVAFRDSVLAINGPIAVFTFGAMTAPGNLHLIP